MANFFGGHPLKDTKEWIMSMVCYGHEMNTNFANIPRSTIWKGNVFWGLDVRRYWERAVFPYFCHGIPAKYYGPTRPRQIQIKCQSKLIVGLLP